MEKGTPLRAETSTLGSESDEEERIAGSETLSTSRELSDISDSPLLHTVDTSTLRYGRKRTRVVRDSFTCHGRTRKRKKERVNESD